MLIVRLTWNPTQLNYQIYNINCSLMIINYLKLLSIYIIIVDAHDLRNNNKKFI